MIATNSTIVNILANGRQTLIYSFQSKSINLQEIKINIRIVNYKILVTKTIQITQYEKCICIFKYLINKI